MPFRAKWCFNKNRALWLAAAHGCGHVRYSWESTFCTAIVSPDITPAWPSTIHLTSSDPIWACSAQCTYCYVRLDRERAGVEVGHGHALYHAAIYNSSVRTSYSRFSSMKIEWCSPITEFPRATPSHDSCNFLPVNRKCSTVRVIIVTHLDTMEVKKSIKARCRGWPGLQIKEQWLAAKKKKH